MLVVDKIEPCAPDESRLKYTVVFIHDGSGFLFCRKHDKETWECAGGHIEAGESAERGALREIYEEAGLRLDSAEAVCDYHATADGQGDTAWGRVFLCRTARLDPPPVPPKGFEMAETRVFADLPENLSYPHIQGELFRLVCEKLLRK